MAVKQNYRPCPYYSLVLLNRCVEVKFLKLNNLSFMGNKHSIVQGGFRE